MRFPCASVDSDDTVRHGALGMLLKPWDRTHSTGGFPSVYRGRCVSTGGQLPPAAGHSSLFTSVCAPSFDSIGDLMFLSRRTLKKESKEGVALDGQPSTLTKELKTLPFLTASCYDEEHKPGGFL